MKPGQFIQWQDLFAMIDDGSLSIARYDPVETAVREQFSRFPQGIALLCILPADTRPPPDEVKLAVKSVLTRMAPMISSLAYAVEGTGFKGVTVRATLVGMKIFSSRSYPIYVETSVEDAVSRLISHMARTPTGVPDIDAILKSIRDSRVTAHPPGMPSPQQPFQHK